MPEGQIEARHERFPHECGNAAIAAMRRYLYLLIVVLSVCLPADIFAQSEREKVIVGWIDVLPFYKQQPSGQPTGFSAEVITKIAERAGFDVEFRHYANVEALFDAFRAGETQIMPAARASSLPEPGMVFSAPISQAEVVVMLRAEDVPNTRLDQIVGRQLGIFVNEKSLEARQLAERNNMVEMPLSGEAILKLLSGDIDVLIAPDAWIAAQLRGAKLDQRVRRMPTPLGRTDRIVALHPSKAHLLGAVNSAIAQLEAKGEIDTLKTIWALNLPMPEPDILTVGVIHFPPYQVVKEDGTYTGFAVEVLRQLAERAGLTLSFKTLTMDELLAGPGSARYDLLPQAGVNNERLQRMVFTQPIAKSTLSMFVRAGSNQEFANLTEIIGRRVAVNASNPARALAEQQDGLELEILDEGEELLPALLEKRTDIVLYPTERMQQIISDAGLRNAIEEIKPPFHIIERAVALRFGLENVRDQLNEVIPSYLVSESYRQLQQTWLGKKIFWTNKRIVLLVVFGILVGLILAGALIRQRWIQRTRDAHYQREERQQLELYEQKQAHVKKQQTLIRELERSNRELDDFAYIASHDLKEPLRGIAINADFLAREQVSEQAVQRIDRMVELTTRMENLISDLLFFSRLGRGDQSQEDINPGDVIGSIERELLETLKLERGTLAIDTELPLLHADRNKIKIVFHNLISNALKYNNSDDKQVNIGFQTNVAIEDKELRDVFYVRDNGIGIDKKNHEKVFRIFTRLNRAKDYGQGTGAGLSFVSKIIEEYGSVPTVASSLGHGTTFYFSLPLACSDQSELFQKAA